MVRPGRPTAYPPIKGKWVLQFISNCIAKECIGQIQDTMIGLQLCSQYVQEGCQNVLADRYRFWPDRYKTISVERVY